MYTIHSFRRSSCTILVVDAGEDVTALKRRISRMYISVVESYNDDNFFSEDDSSSGEWSMCYTGKIYGQENSKIFYYSCKRYCKTRVRSIRQLY